MERKRKLVSVSFKEKLMAIERIKNGEKQLKIAKELGVGASTVRGWLKNEGNIRDFIDQVDTDTGLERKRVRLTDDDEIDRAVFIWYSEHQAIGTPMSVSTIQGKARLFAKKLRGDNFNFEASSGWLWRWQQRYKVKEIMTKKQHAEDIPVESFPAELQQIISIEGYNDEQIYNCGETALFWKLLPSETRTLSSDKEIEGFKKRLMVLLAVNKSGFHKLKLLCVGWNKNPRELNYLNRQNLPLLYESSENAWMTQKVFLSWFNNHFIPQVRLYLRNAGLDEKAILLLYCCPTHTKASKLQSQDGKIKAYFLPKNSGHIQPLDRGIISIFKANYRRQLLLYLLSQEDAGLSVTTAMQLYNLREFFYVCEKAWSLVKSSSIEKCWADALGFDQCVPTSISDENCTVIEAGTELVANEMLRMMQRTKLGAFNITEKDIKNWMQCDDNYETFHVLSDNEIILAAKQQSQSCSSKTETEVDCDSDNIILPSATEAIVALEMGLRFLERQDSKFVDAMQLIQLKGCIDSCKKIRSSWSRQSSLHDFF